MLFEHPYAVLFDRVICVQLKVGEKFAWISRYIMMLALRVKGIGLKRVWVWNYHS